MSGDGRPRHRLPEIGHSPELLGVIHFLSVSGLITALSDCFR